MHIECLKLTNFRCFGPETVAIPLAATFTAFVGDNGSGKTAIMSALLRLFGISQEQRRLRVQDFHIPCSETAPAVERTLSIEAILAFPELQDGDGDHSAVPEFFNQLAIDDDAHPKCRIRLDAKWTADGSTDGSIEDTVWAIRKFGPYEESDCIKLRANDRTRIQMIYVPASRDGASQVATFLRGRLWRAIAWSTQVRSTFQSASTDLRQNFGDEPGVAALTSALDTRWKELNAAGTDTTPLFAPIDGRFEEFIKRIGVSFRPDEAGKERALEELSEGQRSIFHLAMTAATLDVERTIVTGAAAGFQIEEIDVPALTLIAVEEPENSLAPFYLSRIVNQIAQVTSNLRAQALVASHSPSILARVDPIQIRHLRLRPDTRTSVVNCIRMPENDEAASKFLRQAVRAYPELYFARFVILGEGASEEVVLPKLAESIGLQIDRSFVAIVPLGGRHINHLWRLLKDLCIPFATLLDLDYGRHGGGWGRIKTTFEQLLQIGTPPDVLFGQQGITPNKVTEALAAIATYDPAALATPDGRTWLTWLRTYNVFFSAPLDIDYSMVTAFPNYYQALEVGMDGPAEKDARDAVLGDKGLYHLYPENDLLLRWYRYLFLGRGKPSTHVRLLGTIPPEELKTKMPEELRALLSGVAKTLQPSSDVGAIA
jgi:putative ATP-dependent endonuclease of the OLD family